MRYYFQIVDDKDVVAVGGYFKASSDDEASDVVRNAMKMTHCVQAHIYTADGPDEPKHFATLAVIKSEQPAT